MTPPRVVSFLVEFVFSVFTTNYHFSKVFPREINCILYIVSSLRTYFSSTLDFLDVNDIFIINPEKLFLVSVNRRPSNTFRMALVFTIKSHLTDFVDHSVPLIRSLCGFIDTFMIKI